MYYTERVYIIYISADVDKYMQNCLQKHNKYIWSLLINFIGDNKVY